MKQLLLNLENNSDEDWAYLAGLIDGEGSVGIYYNKWSDGHFMQVQIGNMDKTLIDWIHLKFKGRRYLNRKTKFHLVKWHGRHAKEILDNVNPYLISKAGEAKVALMFAETLQTKGANQHSRKKITDDILKKRDNLVDLIKVTREKKYKNV